MARREDNRRYAPVERVERVEVLCKCKQGFYWYVPNGQRIKEHNQMEHKCTACGDKVFFPIPYPALKFRDRIFVDWETIKGLRTEA